MTVYRVWPATNGPAQNTDDNGEYTLAMQFRVSEPCMVTAIYFWRAPLRYDGDPVPGVFPTECGVFDADSRTLVAARETMDDPGATTGWIKHTLATPIAIDNEHIYRVAVYCDPHTERWYSGSPEYWATGDGAAGIDSGIIHVFNDADALGGGGGQDSFAPGGGALGNNYPDGSFNANNYWIDVEVTTSDGPPQDVEPEGIESAEAFGSPSVAPGAVDLAPAGIGSAEAFGAPSVAPGPVTVAPVGIPSALVFGTPHLDGGTLVAAPDLFTYPDAQALAVSALRQALSTRSEAYVAGVKVGSRLPVTRSTDVPTLPFVLCRVDTTANVGRVVERNTLRVTVWHKDEDAAFDLAQLVQALLFIHSGTDLIRCDPLAGPTRTVDPDTGTDLCSLLVRAVTRASALT